MQVDLNADVGESFGRWTLGNDETLLRLVTSANVACGFHAGDPATLVRTCSTAVAAGVRIGAQVGYRDLSGFGRRFIDIAPADLYADVVYQIGALDAIARTCGGKVGYVKPHGALYNAIVTHTAQAQAVVDAVRAVDPALPIVGLPHAQVIGLARAQGSPVIREAFADRAYRPDGSLQPRSEPGAVLTDPAEVAQRAVRMVTEARVLAVDGSSIELAIDSLCLHGDSPGAVEMAQAVRAALGAADVTVRAPVP